MRSTMTQTPRRFDISSATDVGRVRAHNEDSLASDASLGVAVLADGMGGYNAGEVASGIAVAMALAAAFLNAAFGFCLGCEMYLLIARARGSISQRQNREDSYNLPNL